MLVKYVVPKISWSVFSFLSWVLFLEKIHPPSETNQNCRGGDGWCCHLSSETEVGLLIFYMGLTSQEKVPLCLKSYRTAIWGLAFQVALDNNKNHSVTFETCLNIKIYADTFILSLYMHKELRKCNSKIF